MPYKPIIIPLLFVLLVCGGCGLKEATVQKETKSFLLFTGNTKHTTVFIDDLAPITLGAANSDETSTDNQTLYELLPGKHTIIAKRHGKQVVKRNILLGNGFTKEILIP